mmetsp:Transcript_118848/g.343724  ORF Transcript_118848/g.343724 Transcript_118848/m.343724 type:complete len:304 (-) Transcript_118848:96-1007(-)
MHRVFHDGPPQGQSHVALVHGLDGPLGPLGKVGPGVPRAHAPSSTSSSMGPQPIAGLGEGVRRPEVLQEAPGRGHDDPAPVEGRADEAEALGHVALAQVAQEAGQLVLHPEVAGRPEGHQAEVRSHARREGRRRPCGQRLLARAQGDGAADRHGRSHGGHRADQRDLGGAWRRSRPAQDVPDNVAQRRRLPAGVARGCEDNAAVAQRSFGLHDRRQHLALWRHHHRAHRRRRRSHSGHRRPRRRLVDEGPPATEGRYVAADHGPQQMMDEGRSGARRAVGGARVSAPSVLRGGRCREAAVRRR